MVKGLMMLTSAVRVTERATSPRARNEIMFEVTPPGESARTIRPTASAPERPITETTA